VNPEAGEVEPALRIQFSTGGVYRVVGACDQRYGATLYWAANESIRLFWIDTTALARAEVASTVFVEPDPAKEGGVPYEIADDGVLQGLTKQDSAAESPAVQGPVPRDDALGIDPCLASRTEEVSPLASKDLELIQAFRPARGGSRTAEEEKARNDFCKIHYPMVLAIICRSPDCGQDAEDLAQRVWQIAISHLARARFDPTRGTMASWIASIAHRLAEKHARRRASSRPEALTPELAAKLLDPGAESCVKFARKQRHEELRHH